MIDGIRLKVCGLTSLVDAEAADQAGADYLGFNLYPKSPRFIPLVKYGAMMARLPERKRIAILVEPTTGELTDATAAGFDYFQIHFRHDLEHSVVKGWSEVVGSQHLWLAPKLPPGVDVPAGLLPLAKFFLLDTFQPEVFGGTGRTGDWPKFARHRQAHPDKFWVLSGGLNSDNIGDALRQSGATFVDVNTGVETSPGVKDSGKIREFAAAVHRAMIA